MAESKELGRHIFVFNENDNGGEALSLVTTFNGYEDNGDVFVNQELSLQSYCNSASFILCGASLAPENLRKLANELESSYIKYEIYKPEL